VVTVDRQLCDCNVFLAKIKSSLLQGQSLMKLKHDKQHRALEFTIGDWAWLHVNHHASMYVHEAGPSKLVPKFFGPYKVRPRIHNVFHVEFLQRFEGTTPTDVPPLPRIVRGRVVPQAAHVLHTHPTGVSWELLVGWADRSTAEAIWEVLDN
jgi:hypothetical protein